MIPKIIRNNHQNTLIFLKVNKEKLQGRILDLGAGKKPYKWFFKNQEYESCDIYGEQTYLCDSEKIPVENKRYDAIISTQVFEHLPHPWETIKECNRILKIGGFIVITVPQSEEIHEAPNNYYQYTKYGLKRLLEENGFRILNIEPKSRWYSWLAEQFRTANRRNPHMLLFLWPLSEIFFPIVGIIFDVFDTSGLQGEGWNVLAEKTNDL